MKAQMENACGRRNRQGRQNKRGQKKLHRGSDDEEIMPKGRKPSVEILDRAVSTSAVEMPRTLARGDGKSPNRRHRTWKKHTTKTDHYTAQAACHKEQKASGRKERTEVAHPAPFSIFPSPAPPPSCCCVIHPRSHLCAREAIMAHAVYAFSRVEFLENYSGFGTPQCRECVGAVLRGRRGTSAPPHRTV